MTAPTVRFLDTNCLVVKRQYGNGRPALQLIDAEDGSPVATATVNVEGANLAPDEVCIKDYSENEGMLEALVDAGIVAPPRQWVDSGFVMVPICELQPPFREVSHAGAVGRSRNGGRGR